MNAFEQASFGDPLPVSTSMVSVYAKDSCDRAIGPGCSSELLFQLIVRELGEKLQGGAPCNRVQGDDTSLRLRGEWQEVRRRRR